MKLLFVHVHSALRISQFRWISLLSLIFLFHLTTTASCLATTTINDPASPRNAKTVIVSTQKNGGRSQIFPPAFHQTDDTDKNSKKSFQVSSVANMIQNGSQNIQSAIRSTFMPAGYPQKTPPGYLRYSIWSWVQDLSTQLRSVLATQRILEGVGVGREGATALSAMQNFIARDGAGMIATLLFTSVASSRFRCDIKRWRLVADLAVDFGITLEVAAVAFHPRFFLPMICLGNMAKAVCGVAAGACSGAINLHWAQHGSDISDISAKFGAQHTVTGGLGLIFSALFARTVATWEVSKLWILFSALTLLHIIANMRCMRLIAFESINHIRMNLILSNFLPWFEQQMGDTSTNVASSSSATSSVSPNIPTPKQVAKTEPLFFVPNWLSPRQATTRKSSVPIFFGESFNDFCRHSKQTSGADIVNTLLNAPSESGLLEMVLGNDGYLISAGILAPNNNKKLCVDVVFLSNGTPTSEAKAYLHAILLGRKLKKLEKEFDGDNGDILNEIAKIESQVQDDMVFGWNAFQTSCQGAGWDLTATEIQSLGYEIEPAYQAS